MFKRVVLLYPILVASLPVLFLAANNADEVAAAQVISLLALILPVTLLITLLLNLALRDDAKTVIVMTVVLVFVFWFGRLFEFARTAPIIGTMLSEKQVAVLVPLGMLIVIGAMTSVWALWRYRGDLRNVAQAIGLTSLLLVVLNLGILGFHAISSSDSALANEEFVVRSRCLNNGCGELPDIYYIILDGYGRTDVLQEVHSFDNSEFLDYLRHKGFYVAEQSQTNYGTTTKSLASSLNMQYLDDPENVPESMFRDSSVVRVAKTLGYKFVHFSESGSHNKRTELISSVDIEISSRGDGFLDRTYNNEFAAVLVRSSVGRFFLNKFFITQRAEIFSNNVEGVREVPLIDSNTLTILHSYPPHPPYIFDRNGRVRTKSEYRLNEDWDDTDLYIEQLIYLNKVVTEIVDDILAESEVEPVIILQSDHGPMATVVDRDNPSELAKWERAGIINAYYLPKHCRSGLYPSISPVNSFRLVFDQCLGTDFGLLEDETILGTGW